MTRTAECAAYYSCAPSSQSRLVARTTEFASDPHPENLNSRPRTRSRQSLARRLPRRYDRNGHERAEGVDQRSTRYRVCPTAYRAAATLSASRRGSVKRDRSTRRTWGQFFGEPSQDREILRAASRRSLLRPWRGLAPATAKFQRRQRRNHRAAVLTRRRGRLSACRHWPRECQRMARRKVLRGELGRDLVRAN